MTLLKPGGHLDLRDCTEEFRNLDTEIAALSTVTAGLQLITTEFDYTIASPDPDGPNLFPIGTLPRGHVPVRMWAHVTEAFVDASGTNIVDEINAGFGSGLDDGTARAYGQVKGSLSLNVFRTATSGNNAVGKLLGVKWNTKRTAYVTFVEFGSGLIAGKARVGVEFFVI